MPLSAIGITGECVIIARWARPCFTTIGQPAGSRVRVPSDIRLKAGLPADKTILPIIGVLKMPPMDP